MKNNAPYHAHIYYEERDRAAAEHLHQQLSNVKKVADFASVVLVGEMRDKNVGPHPTPQFEVHFLEDVLPKILALIKASHLTALVHPLTDDDLADHTSLALWIGEPLPLDHSALDPPGFNQGVGRFGKSDF